MNKKNTSWGILQKLEKSWNSKFPNLARSLIEGFLSVIKVPVLTYVSSSIWLAFMKTYWITWEWILLLRDSFLAPSINSMASRASIPSVLVKRAIPNPSKACSAASNANAPISFCFFSAGQVPMGNFISSWFTLSKPASRINLSKEEAILNSWPLCSVSLDKC